MLKTALLSISLLMLLVGCREPPNSNSAIKYYDKDNKQVKMSAKYERGPIPRQYVENMCVDGDAISVLRSHRNKSVEDLKNIGSNCVEINLAEGAK